MIRNPRREGGSRRRRGGRNQAARAAGAFIVASVRRGVSCLIISFQENAAAMLFGDTLAAQGIIKKTEICLEALTWTTLDPGNH